MSMDDEVANTLTREIMREAAANTSSLEEIMRVHRRLQFTDEELMGVPGAIKMWRGDGHNVGIGRITAEFQALTPQDGRKLFREFSDQGVCFICAGHPLCIEMAIIKADEGKGLFGGQKAGYHVYIGSGDRRFNSVGRASNMLLAVTKLSPLLRQ